ncbi:MAG: PAS domain S-box protein [Phycisphaerales bacterium]
MATSNALRLLIVEDDIVDRKLLERLLAQSSLGACEVRHANTLGAALDLLKDLSFDVVLLDLGLPDSQGMDSVSRLQSQAPHLPIIVLSGLDDERTATQAVQIGVQDYLIKGQVDASLLMRSIRYALERKKAERQLQATELRYRTIFENSAVAIMMADENRQLVSWNKFTEQLLGRGEEQLRGRDVATLYPPEEWEKICALSIRRRGMQHHLETKMICGNAEVIDVDISLSVVHDSDGRITGSIGVIRDVTERKHMEEALRRSERRFRQVAENAREWIWEVDAEGVYTYASPVIEKILGYKAEELVGKRRFTDFFHPDDAERLWAVAQETFARRGVFKEFENRNVHKEGQEVWLLTSGAPILDENGELLGYRGADVDITERKRAEDALREAHRRLMEIVEFLPDATMVIDHEGKIIAWNKAIEEMTGVPKAQMIGKGDHEYSIPFYGSRRPILIDLVLHPDDETEREKYHSASRAGETLCGEVFVPNVHGGRGAFLWGNACRLRDSRGQIVGAIETVRDVTERHQVEAELRKSEERMRLVVEASPLPLQLSRPSTGQILLSNHAAAELFGYDDETMLQKTTPQLYADAERDRPGILAEAREKGRIIQREVLMRKSDGTCFPVSLSMQPIEYEHEPANLAVLYDLTERKRTEEALRHHLSEIERFNRLAMAREVRVAELKQRINEMSLSAGQPAPYAVLQAEVSSEPESDQATQAPDVPSEGAAQRHRDLAELLDRDQMQQLMDSFCDAVGISSAIIDLEGNVFVGARWQRLCTDFHRDNAETRARCIESDTILAAQLREGEHFSLYQCRNGLTDAASPIVIEGRHVANVFIGQFLLEPPDEEAFRRQARAFGFDEAAYMEALYQVPIVPEKKLPPVLKYLTTCAQLLAEMGLERIQGKTHEEELLRWAEELNRANQALRQQREAALSLAEDANEARATAERIQQSLRESEERLLGMTSAALDAIIMMDEHGRISFWNQAAETMFGYTAQEACGKNLHALLAPSRYHAQCQPGMERFKITGESPVLGKTIELTALRRTGEEFPVELSVGRICLHGEYQAVGIIRDTSERKRVEEALLLKDSAVDSAASGIVFIGLEGTLTFANPSALSMWGYDEENEVLGKPLASFLNAAEEAAVALRHAIENGAWNGEMIARRKDGSDFVAQVLASVVKDKTGKPICVMVSLVDVTESRRIHEILDRKQKNLEAIFDATPLGTLLVNDRMRVTRANDVIRQMSGNSYAGIIDRDVCQALHCVYAGAAADNQGPGRSCGKCVLRDLVQRAIDSDEPARGVEIQLALSDDGTNPRWLSASLEPVNIDGSKHILIVLNDVTDRKRAEDELTQTMELKSQFISTVSHELRTPLSSMKESVIIVLDGVAGKINKDQRHFLDIAKRNMDRLLRLIDDVLDFQKLSAGKMKLNLQENAISVAVNEVYNTMLPYANKTGVHLAMDLQPDLPSAVYDSDRILQALINLVSNAIKFTPEGGRVQVSAYGQPEHLVLKVSDTGYGIPKEDLAKIFDRFYRVHRPGKEIKGTGLGLAIVSKIVDAHGGRIEVESELDKGTTFTVLLPLTLHSAPAADSSQVDQGLESTLTGQ